MRLLPEVVLDHLLDLRHARLTADEDDLVDVLGLHAGVLQALLDRRHRALEEVVDELLQLGAGQLHRQVLRPGGVGGDEGEVDLRLHRRRQLHLGLLRGLLEPLERHPVLPEIDSVLLLELLGDPVHHALVEVVAAQVRVTVGGLDLEHALADFEDRDVERATAQVVHGDRLVLLLVHAVGECGRRRLVDDTHHLEAGDLSGVLGSLALAIVEVRGHGDHGLRHLLPQVGLGRFLQLAEDHGGDLGRRVLLASDIDPHVAVAGLDDLVGHELDLAQNLVVATAHEPLDRKDRVLRVRDGLPLRHLTDEDLAVLGEADHGRSQATALLVRDHGGVPTFHDCDDGVRRAEVDTDHLRHVSLPLMTVASGTSRARPALMRIRLQNVDLDFLRFDFFRLRQPDLQDAVPVRCLHLVGLDRNGKSDRALEFPVHPLEAVIGIVRLLAPPLALALDGQQVAGDRDTDFLLPYARNLERDVEVILRLVHVDQRDPQTITGRHRCRAAEETVEEAIHLLLDVRETFHLTCDPPNGRQRSSDML